MSSRNPGYPRRGKLAGMTTSKKWVQWTLLELFAVITFLGVTCAVLVNGTQPNHSLWMAEGYRGLCLFIVIAAVAASLGMSSPKRGILIAFVAGALLFHFEGEEIFRPLISWVHYRSQWTTDQLAKYRPEIQNEGTFPLLHSFVAVGNSAAAITVGYLAAWITRATLTFSAANPERLPSSAPNQNPN
jgi:hypothetical protein